MHDKAIANAYPIRLPENSVIKQDLGFVGHHPAGIIVEQPFKKPKNAELSFGKKIYNKFLVLPELSVNMLIANSSDSE